MAMESKKAYGFLFQISTKTNKKELAICSDLQKLDFFGVEKSTPFFHALK